MLAQQRIVHECIRDGENGLYLFTLIDHEGREEHTLPVVRSGGGWLHLRAEAAEEGRAAASLRFTTQQLLSGPAAATHIRRFFPGIHARAHSAAELEACQVCIGELVAEVDLTAGKPSPQPLDHAAPAMPPSAPTPTVSAAAAPDATAAPAAAASAAPPSSRAAAVAAPGPAPAAAAAPAVSSDATAAADPTAAAHPTTASSLQASQRTQSRHAGWRQKRLRGGGQLGAQGDCSCCEPRPPPKRLQSKGWQQRKRVARMPEPEHSASGGAVVATAV